ncbi:DUF5050 domain-containing protein [Candidatus Woesearchaeota archaeon]|nr:DUF5050 domain-containing protein [Candidatus Woesearchaeota archaeon]
MAKHIKLFLIYLCILFSFIYIASAATYEKIAFQSHRDGNSEIYTMNPDGTGATRLTSDPDGDESPEWSPDGSKIVFFSIRDGIYQIYVMNSDGTNQTSLSNNLSVEDLYPAWSPEGAKIVFESNRDGNYEIYTMNADGSNVQRLTNNSAGDLQPVWSPDGTKIAFFSDRSGNYEIYVMNADGTNQINLSNNPAIETHPAWSPDGTKIAFGSDRDGNREVYVMNADGSNQIDLSNNPAWDLNPSWSPDGTKITFYSDRDGNEEIYIMNADGTNQTRLTNNSVKDNTPAWSPPICAENWTVQYDSCLLNDSRLKYYIDESLCGTVNDLPVDNGTYEVCDYCTPNWTLNDTFGGCQPDDLQYKNYYDDNSCYQITGLSSDNNIPSSLNQSCDYCIPDFVCNDHNATGYCISVLDIKKCFSMTGLTDDDYTGNYSEFPLAVFNDSIIGNDNDINSSENIDVLIENETLNNWDSMTSTLDIMFSQGNEILAEFSYNFSENILDLTNITVEREKGNGAVKGYIFVKGIQQENTKTIYLHNVSPNFNWVCIKDTDISNISEITSNCKGTNEYHVQCNNQSSNGYRCEDLGGNVYKITGLQHSGIIQADAPVYVPPPSGGGGGSSPRPKPIVVEEIKCNTEFVCGSWSECKDGEQFRNCFNECGETSTSIRSCEMKKTEEPKEKTVQVIKAPDKEDEKDFDLTFIGVIIASFVAVSGLVTFAFLRWRR